MEIFYRNRTRPRLCEILKEHAKNAELRASLSLQRHSAAYLPSSTLHEAILMGATRAVNRAMSEKQLIKRLTMDRKRKSLPATTAKRLRKNTTERNLRSTNRAQEPAQDTSKQVELRVIGTECASRTIEQSEQRDIGSQSSGFQDIKEIQLNFWKSQEMCAKYMAASERDKKRVARLEEENKELAVRLEEQRLAPIEIPSRLHIANLQVGVISESLPGAPSQYKERISELEAENEALAEVTKQQTVRISEQSSDISLKETEVGRLQERNSALEAKAQGLEASVAQATADNEQLRQELLRYQAESATQGSRIKELKERSEAEENQKNRYKEQLKAESLKLQSCTEERKELFQLLDAALSQTYESIQRQLAAAGHTFANLCDECDDWVATSERFKEVLVQFGVDVSNLPINAISKVYSDPNTGLIDLGQLSVKITN